MRTRTALATLAIAAYLACILGANAAIQHYGIISVGFGLAAPAGVYFIGPALPTTAVTSSAALRSAGSTSFRSRLACFRSTSAVVEPGNSAI